MRNHELGIKSFSFQAVLAVCGWLSLSVSGALAADGAPRLPSFVGARELPALPASGDMATEERDAAILRSADEARRRAEEERIKAVEIRRQAEALSQRFAAEIPAAVIDSAPAVVEKAAVTGPVPAATPVVTGAIARQSAASPAPVSEAALARARQAEAELQEARDALAKARAELEDATRRATEAAAPRMASDDEVKPAAPKHNATKHAKAAPAKPAAPAKVVPEPDRRIAEAPRAAKPAETTAAVGGSAIQGPTMGRQPRQEPAAVAASTGENPITGLLSKVFGGGSEAPSALGFNQ